MAQPVPPAPDPFRDEAGYFRSPVEAAAYAIVVSGGQGFTTPAVEARRMLTSPDPRYVDIAQMWLMQHGLPEAGDSELPGWQNWFGGWLAQHPEAVVAPPGLHAVPDLPPAPPKKVVVQVEQGSRLESLLAQREEIKAALDEWTKRMATVKDGITAELTEQHPGTGAFDIPAGPGRPAMTLRYTAPNMFDTKRFKEERPDLYPQFLKPSPRWTLGVPQQKNSQ